MAHDRLQRLIQGLQKPQIFDHPTEGFELVETHISCVLLVGPFAYKFKKPVNFGFVDFTTLEKRRFYCEEELRLNKRLAPELYLAVVAVTGTEDAPRLGGPGSPIEYAVKMRRFPRAAQLDQVLARGELTPGLVEALAQVIAKFHGQAEIATPDTPHGSASEVGKYALENFAQIGTGPEEIDARNALASLRAWTETQLERHRDLIDARKRQGRVRQCHGDLHLTNMVLLDGEIVVFDGIEFNAALSFVDVMSEIAFLLMDLKVRERPDLAWIFLNRYLEETGDYEGLPLLKLYLVYRSMVRAKVAYLEYRDGAGKAASCLARYDRHLALARRYTEPHPPGLILLTHGFSGSGKTSQSAALVPRLGALRIRSDVERKRLAGLSAETKTGNAVTAGIYDPTMTERTYERLRGLARIVSHCGIPVIVDAAFLARGRREEFAALARTLGAPFRILDFRASETTLRARIARRALQGRDASEADLAVLDHQLRTQEPLTPHEQSLTLVWSTERPSADAPIALALADAVSDAQHLCSRQEEFMLIIKRILCAVDFSEPSARALRYALALAERLGAQVDVIHAYELPTYALPEGAVELLQQDLGRRLREDLDQFVKAQAGEVSGTAAHLVEGVPYLQILEAAKQHRADLIVIGTHGRTGLSHMLLGSVAERVVRAAEVPVLSIRSAGAP